MIAKINIFPIIRDHLESFKDRDQKKFLKKDLFGFYALPCLLALLMVWAGFSLTEKYINTAIIAQTIFIPLLVNVLVIVYGLIDRIDKRRKESGDHPEDEANKSRDRKKIRLLRQLYANISYTILASALCLAALAVYSMKDAPKWVIFAVQFLVYFLAIHLILISLMIIKRFHLLMDAEIE